MRYATKFEPPPDDDREPTPIDGLNQAPADTQAEKATLGALLLDNRLRDRLAELVDGPDFYQPAHEAVWLACCHLIDQGIPADPVTVWAELVNRGQARTVQGGPLALIEMTEAATIAANGPAYASIVRDRAVQRRTLDASVKIRQMALAGGDPVSLVDEAQRALQRLDTSTCVEAAGISETLDAVVASYGTAASAGHQSPWPDLNRTLPGFQPGRLHVIAARPGVGKSLMGQGLAVHFAAHHRQQVLWCSLEMSAVELGKRMMSQASGVHLSDLDTRYPSQATRQQIAEVAEQMKASHAGLHLIADGSQTVASVRQAAKSIHARSGLGLVVVDYLQLLTPGQSSRKDRNREQEVAEMSRGFKALAMELDVPVVVLSQLNRAMLARADKRPSMGDLRESGATEQNADVVILLHLENPDERPAELTASVEKNRSGATGECRLIRQGWIANIANAERNWGAA